MRRDSNWSVRLLAALVVLAAASVSAHAQNSVFVYIPTIPGSSVDAAHPSWIDAYALDHSATAPAGGAATFSGVTILKGADAATAALHDAIARGLVLGSSTSNPVKIDVCRNSPDGQECFYQISMAVVRVTQEAVSGSSCLDPSSCAPSQTESVTFSFSQITWRYIQYQNGKKGAVYERCWDLSKGTTCSPF